MFFYLGEGVTIILFFPIQGVGVWKHWKFGDIIFKHFTTQMIFLVTNDFVSSTLL